MKNKRINRVFSIMPAVALVFTLLPLSISAATYTVQPDDWLNKIAKQYEVTWQELHKINPQIANPDRIYPGQVIYVPGENIAPAPSAEDEIKLPPVEGDRITASDYSDANNWSIITRNPDKPVDVFVLYPSTYEGQATLSDINDTGMCERADGWFLTKGSAFETAGNIFMPYYRQLNAFWLLAQPLDQQPAYVRGAPKTDVLAAFDYYLKNYNNGRPFIIAAHSQGTSMAMEILFDYFVQNPEPAERMVAAYALGYSITPSDLARNPAMKFAESADDTGVIISYNTVAPGAEPSPAGVIQPGAMAINPISWTRSGENASADANLGSFVVMPTGMEIIMGLADATVDTERGIVICSTADFAIYGIPAVAEVMFGTGSYHNQDIGFYYFNLRQNAENRVEKFLNE